MRSLSIDTVYFQSNMRRNTILTICWCLLADLAIIIKFMISIPYNYSLHIILFTIISVITLIELILLNIEGMPNYNIQSKEIFVYYILTVLIISFTLIQIVFGLIKRWFQKRINIEPGLVIILIKFHKYMGYLLLLFCKTFILVGWHLSNHDVITIIFCILIFLEMIGYLYLRIKSKSLSQLGFQFTSSKQNITVLPIDNVNQYQYLIKIPYNSPKLADYKFFIFNDKVYEFENFEFHPGGAKIIQLTNHRQIDRFLYGMYHLENYPNLNRFDHPKNSFNLLKNPVYTIPKNTLYRLTSQNFIIIQKYQITNNLAIFYMKQEEENLQYNEKYDLSYLGQYFTLKCFGMTRIYACAKTQSRKHRKITKMILKLLKINNKLDLQTLQNYEQKINLTENSTINLNHRQQILQKNNLENTKQQIHQDYQNELCVIIKKYTNQNGFSFKIHQNYLNLKLKVSGLTGRGLCLSQIQKGTVVIIIGGAIFPFLDLFDMIFKILASKNTRLSNEIEKQVLIYENLLKDLKFIFIGAFEDYKLMIIPQVLYFMNECQNPLFKMHLKLNKSHPLFEKCSITGKFSTQFFEKHISIIEDLSMIYSVGPPSMGQDLIKGSKQCGVPFSKLFFV